MSESGFQPRGENNSPRGISHVIVLRAAKILPRHCQPGEIIKVEPSDRSIFPATDGLTGDAQVGPSETLLDHLMRLKVAKPYSIRAGDKVISVRPIPPRLHGNPEPEVETALNPAPARAERAVGKPQRGAV